MSTSQGAPEAGATELKPCPFCGGEAHFIDVETPDPNGGWKVSFYKPQCKSCRTNRGDFTTKADGAEAWNRRAASPSPPPGMGELTDAVEAGKALDRLREIAYRDGAVSVTVHAADLRAFLEETQRYVIRTAKRNLVMKEAEDALREAREHIRFLETCVADPVCASPDLVNRIDAALARLGAAP